MKKVRSGQNMLINYHIPLAATKFLHDSGHEVQIPSWTDFPRRRRSGQLHLVISRSSRVLGGPARMKLGCQALSQVPNQTGNGSRLPVSCASSCEHLNQSGRVFQTSTPRTRCIIMTCAIGNLSRTGLQEEDAAQPRSLDRVGNPWSP